MTDETPQGPHEPAEFHIGFDQADPEIMIIQVPLREWALDAKHGAALLHGHMREAEAVGMRAMMDIRKRRAQGGIITPPGTNGREFGVH
jgi:hypothetical protein